MTRAEHRLLFPSLTPSHPFLLPQSYIFEKNFYLFFPSSCDLWCQSFCYYRRELSGFLFILTLTAVIIMSLELH